MAIMLLFHIPMLGIAEGASVESLGGTARRFLFDEFKRLDPDWARDRYFVESTAIWAADDLAGLDAETNLISMADLFRLAALAILEAPLASPKLSVRYSICGALSTGRILGPLERTLLLSDSSVASADAESLKEIGALADKWHAAGFGPDHPILSALHAFGSVYTAFNTRPELAMMPTMVALEGIIAYDNAPNIATRMSDALKRLLPESNLADRLRDLYAIRSDIIHGRSLDQSAADATTEIGTIACRATIALIDRATQRALPPDRWTHALEDLA